MEYGIQSALITTYYGRLTVHCYSMGLLQLRLIYYSLEGVYDGLICMHIGEDQHVIIHHPISGTTIHA